METETTNTPKPPVNTTTGDDGVAREYFFPGINKTVTAISIKEAQEKVEALVKADNKN